MSELRALEAEQIQSPQGSLGHHASTSNSSIAVWKVVYSFHPFDSGGFEGLFTLVLHSYMAQELHSVPSA